MAKTKQWQPRRIRSEEDRGGGGSQYISLSEGENFVGQALFAADPSVDDPAYYEFAVHWVQNGAKANSVPCAADDCPLCEEGDRAKTRAYSLWLVSQDENKNKLDPPQLRIFEMNYNIIKIFTEWRAEGDKIKGMQYRVSRLDDRGNYNITPKVNGAITATAIKEALKDPQAPDFDQMITSKLRKAMEGLAVAKAVEDDDDDDDAVEEKKTAKKTTGKPAAKAKAAEWPDELDEEEVTVTEVEDDGNYFTATNDAYKGPVNIYTTKGIKFDLTDLAEDQVVTVSGAKDDDGDYILSAEPEVGEAEEPEEEEEPAEEEETTAEGELPDNIEDVEFKVKSVDANEFTMEVENDDLSFTLFFLDQGPASEVDFDDYEEGVTITVSAEKDSQGDMVATEIPAIKKAGRKTAAATGGRKKTTTTKGK